MHIDFEFPDNVARVVARSLVVDMPKSKKWLGAVSGKIASKIEHLPRKIRREKEMPVNEAQQDPEWLRKWRRKYREEQYQLIKKGKGMSSCIIWERQERRRCCKDYLDKQEAVGELRVYKFRFCMRLVKVYVETLLETGVLLAEDDEEKLEDELSKVLAKMAKERAAGKTHVSLTPLYEVGIDHIVPDDDMRPLTDEEKRRYEEEAELLKFLVAMKQIEYMIHENQDNHVNEEQKAVYSAFMEAFNRCFEQKKTAVSYHTAEKRWTTCGPVIFSNGVAGYCADLAAVDPKARELSRKPILKWESGAYEHVHDLLDPEKIEDIPERTVVQRRNHVGLRRAVDRAYRDVDLFQAELARTDNTCNGVDLANACYAMCCDSEYKMSYYCRTQGLRCIG